MANRLVIIIPAYNEEKRIGATLKEYVRYFSEHEQDYHFTISYCVALNGCTDRTREVVESVQRMFPRTPIVLYEWKERIGKGGAVHNTFQKIDADYVGYVDADNATKPVEFAKLLAHLRRYQVVIASRWMKDAQVHNRKSALRKISSKLFSFAVRMFFHMPYQDTQCGAKVFHMGALRPVLPHLRVHDMAFDVELLYALHQRGVKIAEVPTIWIAHDRESSSLHSPLQIMRQGIQMARSLFRIRFTSPL